MTRSLMRLETCGYLLLILSEDTILISSMTYCNRLAITIARGCHRIALNESGEAMLWGEIGVNRIFERWPEKGKRGAGIVAQQISLYNDRVAGMILAGNLSRKTYSHIRIC